jgi:DNA-binding HxlR family transcriptional regulator
MEPAERLVRTLAGRWTLAVLGELTTRGRRYQDLHDALDLPDRRMR